MVHLQVYERVVGLATVVLRAVLLWRITHKDRSRDLQCKECLGESMADYGKAATIASSTNVAMAIPQSVLRFHFVVQAGGGWISSAGRLPASTRPLPWSREIAFSSMS